MTVSNSRQETVLLPFHVLAAQDIDDDGDGYTETKETVTTPSVGHPMRTSNGITMIAMVK